MLGIRKLIAETALAAIIALAGVIPQTVAGPLFVFSGTCAVCPLDPNVAGDSVTATLEFNDGFVPVAGPSPADQFLGSDIMSFALKIQSLPPETFTSMTGLFGGSDLAGDFGLDSGGLLVIENIIISDGSNYFEATNIGTEGDEFLLGVGGVNVFQGPPDDGPFSSFQAVPAVPEPGTVTTFLLGSLGLLTLARRRRRT